MPPTRRYLRLTAHTVLEVRIYLDNPSDTHRWLLHPTTPALPAIVASVRPLVLPRLKEENDRAASKGGKSGSGKKKGWKDVVRTDDFEVAMFLTETSVRHSILKREKKVRDRTHQRLGSTNGKLTGTREEPMLVNDAVEPPMLLREESEDDEGFRLKDVPLAEEKSAAEEPEGLFVSDEEEGTSETWKAHSERDARDQEDDKKKLALDTTYDGFSIYGRILCLVVKRLGTVKGKAPTQSTGQAMMEEWISSTQMSARALMDE